MDPLGGEADDDDERGLGLRLWVGLVAIEDDEGVVDEFVVGVGVILFVCGVF